MYKSKSVTEYDPIDESFSELPLEVQKEAAEGILYAQEKFGLKVLPYKIGAGPLYSWVAGEHRTNILGHSIVTINSSKMSNINLVYPTMVHEMAHQVDTVNNNFSGDIVKKALKNLGLRSNSKEGRKFNTENGKLPKVCHRLQESDKNV